ncbi:hypothetical protein C0Q70_12054 [Pomacea canaliculata]|uniref:Uncharacterized protein n=1 Tax=Pomacea canaliculata TaxID=400727 RepID=A0A2T7P0H1_POMCA|nr:uncharacterized protein LOC112569146 [Pomacea canaliculata]PVD26906.1 hypothetical protein C0Q70_12054 [Pomacea canaliculata]
MDTARELLSMFVVVVWTLTNGSQISTTNCGELHFVGLSDLDDVITVESGKELSVTFHLNCQKSSYKSVVRVTKHEEFFSHNICIILLDNQSCYVTNSSHPCRCVNETFAQFHKTASLSDEGKYQWSTVGKLSQQRIITFRIIPTFVDEAANREKSVLVGFLSLLSFGFLIIIVAFVHWIVRRKRGYEVQGAGVSNPPHYVNFTSRVESVCLDNCQHGLEENDYDDVIPGSLQNIYNDHRQLTQVPLPYKPLKKK